jgi:hypothetical protein
LTFQNISALYSKIQNIMTRIFTEITPTFKVEIGVPSQNHIRIYGKDGYYSEIAIGQWSEVKAIVDKMIQASATLNQK